MASQKMTQVKELQSIPSIRSGKVLVQSIAARKSWRHRGFSCKVGQGGFGWEYQMRKAVHTTIVLTNHRDPLGV